MIVTFIGNDPDLNVFTFDGTDIDIDIYGRGIPIGLIYDVKFQVPEGATSLVNVLGLNLKFKLKVDAYNEKSAYILWNFPQSVNLTFKADIYGALLAPYATADLDNFTICNTAVVLNLFRDFYSDYCYEDKKCLPEVEQCTLLPRIISIKVWKDENGNCIRDNNEAGIAKIKATLFNSDDGTSTGLSSITDDKGCCNIADVPEGTYYIQIINLLSNYETDKVDTEGKTEIFYVEGITMEVEEYTKLYETIDIKVPVKMKNNPVGSIGDMV